MTAVVGSGRSGKTALLSVLGGAVPAVRGTVRVLGLDCAADALAVRKQVCSVVAGMPLLPHLTVLEQLRWFAAVSDTPRTDHELVFVLRQSEVPDRLMRRRCATLTSYQRLCVWLAAHRARKTRLLLLDDPAEQINARESADFARLVREVLTADSGVVFTSRDLGVPVDAADCVLFIQHGKLARQPRQ